MSTTSLAAATEMWPTIRTGDAKQGPTSAGKRRAKAERDGTSPDVMLSDAVLWPTADTFVLGGDGQNRRAEANGSHAVSLTHAVAHGPPVPGEDLPPGYVWPDRVEGGRLSPRWVECLMGTPMGWTDPDAEPVDVPGPVAPRAKVDAGALMWPTSTAKDAANATAGRRGPSTAHAGETLVDVMRSDGNSVSLDGASPQLEWEPPRTVVPVRGDGRGHQLRCLGNGVDDRPPRAILGAIHGTT